MSFFKENHSSEELRQITRRLSAFRLYREHPAHGDGSERLVAAIPYESQDDLFAIFATLGLMPKLYSKQPPQPLTGETYPLKEYQKFKRLIPGTAFVEQPENVRLAGFDVYIWYTESAVNINVEATNWVIGEQEIGSAERIEELLSTSGLQHLDTPVESALCLCRKYHPAYFG
ncbi:MAG: hypothetical protein IPN40_16745 [Uliginosibacterium sp.]|nr:hypothetical protein [Uliginosibacterium sp.]